MRTYKPNEFAKLLNVSVKTLQRWDKEGILTAHRNPKGRRYYLHSQYEEYMGIQSENKVGRIVIYGRVSNRGQKDDLTNQLDFLREYANANGLIVDEVISDIGSGLNYKRKNWNKLLDDIMERKIQKVIIAHKDRFVRFGFDWFSEFLRKNGTELIIVNNDNLSPQEELTQDLISIIHVFSCRIYGLRKYKKKIIEDKDLS